MESNNIGGKVFLLAIDIEGGTVFRMEANFNEIRLFQGIYNLAKQNLTTEEGKNCY